MPRPEASTGEVVRFRRTSRWVHWSVTALVAVLGATGAVLYVGPLSVLVGDRGVVETVHVWCGLALPVPLLAGLLDRSFRDDVRRLDRFGPDDARWLRQRTRRDDGLRVGKFNAGQKLNAALSAGALAVLLLTGCVLRFPGLVDLPRRTGATLVHDWTALALGLLVLGHVRHALSDGAALRGMVRGAVPLRWARREHPVWAEEVAGPHPPS